MKINCRIYTSDDIDDLVNFWNENSGWDVIDKDEWKRRFYYTPLGEAAVSLAIDKSNGEIVGQFVFIPTVISVDGKEIKAFRPFAPVVKESLRSGIQFLALIEIVLKMYNYAIDYFKGTGVGLIHMLPDPRWSRAFKFLSGVQMGYFPLWSLPLPLKQSFEIDAGYQVKPISAVDERIDGLWDKASNLYGCSFVRNTKTLPWKTSHGAYHIIGIFKNDELIGLSASIVKEKDKQWLVCDMITADVEEALSITIKATCNLAQEYIKANQGTPIQKVAILTTALIEQCIKQLGFKQDNYRFPIVVQLLDENLSKNQVAPERWYASAND